jgi:hypothetical protein
MYENATTLKFRTGKLNDGLSILRDVILPVLLDQPGMIHIGLVPNVLQEKVSVVSLWATREDALALEQNCAFLRAVRKLEPLLTLETPVAPDMPNPLRKIAVQIPLN